MEGRDRKEKGRWEGEGGEKKERERDKVGRRRRGVRLGGEGGSGSVLPLAF